jgi:hypothetical protein
LVMVALVLSESIQQILGTSEALALQSGYWWLDEDQLKCTQDNSPPRSLSDRLFQLGMRQPKKATLEIPREMELVILGKEGVNQLLGKVNVEALSNLTQDCANITSFSYLFLPMVPESGGRQLSKRKHAPEEMLDTSEEGQTREAKQSRSVAEEKILDPQVAEILNMLQLSKYKEAFAQQEITYKAFVLLEEHDLEKMGIPIGPCKLILAEVQIQRKMAQC